jgi:2-polyprenyl-6-methoxyphenol hydroxylase-like FAD-dependent oxidoreductase
MARTVLVSFNLPLTDSPTILIVSIVRQQLLPQSLGINYLPVACIIGGAVISKELYERQLRLAHSYHLVFGEDCRFLTLIGSIAEDKQTAWYYWVVNWIDEDVATADHWLRSASAEERLELAKKKCAGIDPSLLEVLEATRPDGMEGYFPVRDLLPSAIPEGRITLLGDAFHPMTFFKGEGGNHAIQDALDLGKLLQEDAFARRHLYSRQKDADWVQLLTKYCEKTLPRGKEAVLSNREAALEHSRGSRGKLASNTYPTMSTEAGSTLANSKC